MKKRFSLISVLVVVSLVLLFSGCGQKEPAIGIDDAVALLKKMSQNPLGITYKAEPANIKITPDKKGSLIILNEPEITFDTSIYKELGMPMFLKTEKIPMKVKQLELLYNPTEKYLELLSLKGFAFDWDLTQGNITGSLKVTTQDMSFKGYNLSPLLDEKIEDSLRLLMELLKQNPTIQASAHGLNYEMITQVADKEVSFLFGVEEMEWVQKGNAAPLITLFKKGGEKSFDFADLLSSGSPLLDMEGDFSGLRFSMKQGGQEMGAGEVAESNFRFFLKPDKKKEFFTYGFSWGLESLKISASGKNKKLIERIGDIKSLNMDFALGHITPEFIQAYFDLVKENMAVASSGELEKMQQVRMNQGMKLAGAFAQSQPTIRFALTPLKHYFGTMEAEANFQFQGQGMPAPVGKATLRLNNMDEVLKSMKDELSLPETVMVWMQSMFVKDGNDGVLTFEIKNEPPVTLYLNGQPIKQPTD